MGILRLVSLRGEAMTHIGRLLATSAFSLAAVGFASAADLTRDMADFSDDSPAFADEWVISTTPYFWMTFYDGTMTIDGVTVDMSGTNVFDLLDAGDLRFPPLTNYLEARRGRWGAYLDTTFIGLNFGSDFTIEQPPATLPIDLDFTYVLINAGVIYTAAEWATANGTVAVDLMGGVRYTYYDIDMTVSAIPAIAETLDWWDITLGGRVRGEFDGGWFWNLRGDIAGADLESDFSAQAVATIGRDFQLGRLNMGWLVGYRFLYQDWSDGNDAVDLITHGPLVGLTFNF